MTQKVASRDTKKAYRKRMDKITWSVKVEDSNIPTFIYFILDITE